MRPPLAPLALLAGSLLLGGCARAALQYGRDGLAPVDRIVRSDLEAGQYGSAYEASFQRDAGARDRLLRALAAGTLGLYASRTDSSVWALDRAWALTEDRWSKRVGNAAASLVTNDYVLPYTPGATERLFIPFYGALSWMSRGDHDDAAVEARRLSQLLGVAPDTGDASAARAGRDALEVRGLLHYLAGAVFEAAGDRTDADVSYRNAARLVRVPVSRDTTVADSLLGDVVVVLEQGFVGHPVPREETVWLTRDEYSALRMQGDAQSLQAANAIRLREGLRGYGAYYPRRRYEMGVSINWSEFADGRPVARAVSLVAPDAPPWTAGQRASGNVSRAVRADFERGQAARFTRALMRAATRATLVKAAGDQLDKAGGDDQPGGRRRGGRGNDRSGEHGGGAGATPGPRVSDDLVANGRTTDKEDRVSTAGRVLAGLGLFAIAAASEVNDVPDLRSWNLLPYDLRVLRLRLPAGEQDVRALVDGQEIIVGHATVRPGQVTVVAQRLFRSPAMAGVVAGGR